MALDQIHNVFVLMLENRSFDHLLGFSGITGTDAVTGAQTTGNGLSGTETNSYNGTVGTVSRPADDAMDVDPGHESADVLCQLGGAHAPYTPAGVCPAVDSSGFVASYALKTRSETAAYLATVAAKRSAARAATATPSRDL